MLCKNNNIKVYQFSIVSCTKIIISCCFQSIVIIIALLYAAYYKFQAMYSNSLAHYVTHII